MADIVLRLRIDDKDYDAKIINADQQLKKLRGSTDEVVKSTSMLGNVGKRDIKVLASQLLYTSGITGRFGSQLTGIAQGLLTGGAVGAAFAGFAALINLISQEANTAASSMQLLQYKTEDVASAVNGLREAYRNARIEQEALTQTASLQRYNDLLKELDKTNDTLIDLAIKNSQRGPLDEDLTDKLKWWGSYRKNILDELSFLESLFVRMGNESTNTNKTITYGNKKVHDEKIENLKTEIIQLENYYQWLERMEKKGQGNHRDRYYIRMEMEEIAARQKEELAKQTSEQKEELAKQTSEAEMQSADQTLGHLAGAYAQHTAVFKAASAAQALINTYSAAQAALAPPPLGLGPILGPALAALVVAGGLARVASILSTEIPGYAKGGIVVGEKGPEVIVPMDSYAEGQSLLVAKTVAALQGNMRGVGNGNVEKKLDQVIMAFQQKQFRIRYDDLYTANDKSNLITEELEF